MNHIKQVGNNTSINKKNRIFILGILILCVGMQFANYGAAVCLSGEIEEMNATQYYVLISSLGTLGMMLILPVVGKLTAILGQRTLIMIGIVIQFAGRFIMMFSAHWIPYSVAFLLQSVGGGCYISCAYVLIPTVVDPSSRSKYFGYIAIANAIGAITGPIVISLMFSMGGIMRKLSYVAYLPIAIVGYLMVMRGCPNKRQRAAMSDFDYLGVILTIVGLASLVLWMNLSGKMFSWVSAPSIVLLFLTIINLIWMIRRELTINNPSIPIKMFKNKRLTFAFICVIVTTAYSTCAGSYCVVWIRENYSAFPASSFFVGTATMAQQIVILVLGLFLGAYIGKKFARRFRVFGILAMITAMLATGMLYCLKFTGTSLERNLVILGNSFPLGMLIIYCATAIGGFTSVVASSTFSAFWQSNTPKEDIPAGASLYSVGSTGGSAIFGAIVGAVLGSSGDYSRAFATGLAFSVIGLICAIIGFRFSKEEILHAE